MIEDDTELGGPGERAAALRPLFCMPGLGLGLGLGPRRPMLVALAAGLLASCAPAAGPADPVLTPPLRDPGATERLVLLSTTDVHGWLLGHDYYTGAETGHGLAHLAPLIDSVRAANPGRVYLFDSGDLLQGNALAYVHARVDTTGPSPIIAAMNALDYDAAAIGNHEFNYGLPHLQRALEQADFPFLSANIFHAGTESHAYRASALLPHVTATGDTLLIGVTGNTPPGVHLWDRANVDGFIELRDIVASLQPEVRRLRQRGADLVVVLSHGGLEGTSYDTTATGLAAENAAARVAREVDGVDVILLGHTHQELADTTINGVLLAQARNWARSLAAIDVELQRAAPGHWQVVAASGRTLRPSAGRADTAALGPVAAAHERTLAWVRSTVGTSADAMSAARARVEDTPILDFINEVQRRAAGAQLSSTAAFNIGARIPDGPIRIADIAALYIYDNTLMGVRLSGAALRDYLEKSAEYYNGWPPPPGGTVTNRRVPGYNFDVVSGVDYTIDLARPPGRRITRLDYAGRAVQPEDTFTLALNNYRQGGGGGFSMLADAPVVYDRQEDIRDLLIAEVRRQGTLRAADYFERNWQLVPQAAADSAYREQTAGDGATRATSP
ncbi:MAG: bifunctional metallophosphatase/5'-nucleotidase, partial [Longimicrobiales bacterium]